MKELDQIALQEGLFASIKEHLCLTKGHLDSPEGQVEVESPPNRKLFLISFIDIRKKTFFKKDTFNEASDLRTLYLSRIGPESTKCVPFRANSSIWFHSLCILPA